MRDRNGNLNSLIGKIQFRLDFSEKMARISVSTPWLQMLSPTKIRNGSRIVVGPIHSLEGLGLRADACGLWKQLVRVGADLVGELTKSAMSRQYEARLSDSHGLLPRLVVYQ